MEKEYEEPCMEVIELRPVDVVCASDPGDNDVDLGAL